MKQLCDLMAVLASIFLGIAIIETVGKLFLGGFPQVPYLTANIASSIDYAWAYAVVLYGVRWGLQKMAGIEDDEQNPRRYCGSGSGSGTPALDVGLPMRAHQSSG